METINGMMLKQMLESGMNHLSNRAAEIDALNVFPVPDGDTGTNMCADLLGRREGCAEGGEQQRQRDHESAL